MMRSFVLIICCSIAFVGCKKKRNLKPPEQVQLLFPEQNSECITGEPLTAVSSLVEFKWSASENTDTYALTVINANLATLQNVTTTSTSVRLPLTKGEQYSWYVRSSNKQVADVVTSAQWNFYNTGSRTTFAPFPAEIISPESGEKLFKDINNEINLSWTASDLDEDIVGYEVYLSTENPPTTLLSTLLADQYNIKATVTSNTIYYWSVVVIDAEDNRSKSGVFSFTVL